MHRAKLPYNDYGSAMRNRLGGRVQKLAIDVHLGCPHRNAINGEGGCTFCLGEAFTPSYCDTQHSITEQINAAIAFHTSRRRSADIFRPVAAVAGLCIRFPRFFPYPSSCFVNWVEIVDDAGSHSSIPSISPSAGSIAC